MRLMFEQAMEQLKLQAAREQADLKLEVMDAQAKQKAQADRSTGSSAS